MSLLRYVFIEYRPESNIKDFLPSLIRYWAQWKVRLYHNYLNLIRPEKLPEAIKIKYSPKISITNDPKRISDPTEQAFRPKYNILSMFTVPGYTVFHRILLLFYTVSLNFTVCKYHSQNRYVAGFQKLKLICFADKNIRL